MKNLVLEGAFVAEPKPFASCYSDPESFASCHSEPFACLVILSPSLLVILSEAKNLIPLRVNSAKNLILLRTGSVKGKNLLFTSFLSSGLRASAHQGKLRKATS